MLQKMDFLQQISRWFESSFILCEGDLRSMTRRNMNSNETSEPGKEPNAVVPIL